MLDVHAPHEPVNSWRSFFTHIAIIVIGLFIAVGLDQGVEFLHHRQESQELQRQMRGVFQTNMANDLRNLRQTATVRAYLTELRAAIDARLRAQTLPATPSPRDPRMGATLQIAPSMAPYDAAKENGTIALLPEGLLSVYNRIDYQRQLLAAVQTQWLNSLRMLAAFNERFVDSDASLELGEVTPAPDLAILTAADLREYLGVVSTLIKDTVSLAARYGLFNSMCQAALGAPRDENELIRKSIEIQRSAGWTGTFPGED